MTTSYGLVLIGLVIGTVVSNFLGVSFEGQVLSLLGSYVLVTGINELMKEKTK